jgi:hypothetical protein
MAAFRGVEERRSKVGLSDPQHYDHQLHLKQTLSLLFMEASGGFS